MADMSTGAIKPHHIHHRHHSRAMTTGHNRGTAAPAPKPTFGQDLVNFGNKAINYAEGHPGQTLAAGIAIGVGVVEHKKIEDAVKDGYDTVKDKAGEVAGKVSDAASGVAGKVNEASSDAVSAVVDHPFRSAAIVGGATYLMEKHGAEIREGLKPENLKGEIADVQAQTKSFVKEHKVLSAFAVAGATWLVAKEIKKHSN